MSWIQKLYETYEACIDREEFTCPEQPVDGSIVHALMPICHISQQAHIQVTIDAQGNFVRAEMLPAKTVCIIPATEESAARTSGERPHPLSDKIHYIAKDYVGNKKNIYQAYVEQLKGWCQNHPMAQAVLAYVEKGCIVHDLVKAGILLADDLGHLLDNPPENNKGIECIFDRLASKNQADALVVWNVLLPNEYEPRTWENKSLRKAWIDYVAQQDGEENICLVHGK